MLQKKREILVRGHQLQRRRKVEEKMDCHREREQAGGKEAGKRNRVQGRQRNDHLPGRKRYPHPPTILGKMALHYHQTARQKAGHIRELQKGVGSSNLSWVTSLKASTDHGAGFFRDGENKQKAMCKKWQPYSSRSPSFLRKEVPRRGGGWLPQRIEKEWEEAVPLFVIHHGKIQMLDTPHMVYHRPANVFVAKCIGSPSMMAKQTSIWTIPMERQIFGRSCIGQGNIPRTRTSLSSMNRMKS